MGCVFHPCLCNLMLLEKKISQIKGEEEIEIEAEGSREIGESPEVVEEGVVSPDLDTKEGGQREVYVPNTPPPNPQSTPAKEEASKEVEEERVKEPTLVEMLRITRKKKEEEEKKEPRKRSTPLRRIISKKRGDEARKEAPMRRMMEGWLDRKQEEKKRGVKELLEKFSKEEDTSNSFSEWRT